MVKPAFHGSVTASTIGEGNPSHLTERKDYAYKGREGWPLDPATRDDKGVIQPPRGGAKTRKAEREKRLAIYIAARTEGLDIVPAGERAGVESKTAYRYERDMKDRQQGEARDA